MVDGTRVEHVQMECSAFVVVPGASLKTSLNSSMSSSSCLFCSVVNSGFTIGLFSVVVSNK